MKAEESNANATRFCVDCVHYVASDFELKHGDGSCHRKIVVSIDRVNGKTEHYHGGIDARHERYLGGCQNGQHWTPKPERKPSGFDLWAKWMGFKKE